MCGRYVTISKIKTIEKRFNVVAPTPFQYQPNTNVSHGNLAPVITNESPKSLQLFQFGFTPHWAKKQFYTVNARAEGDHNKEDDQRYSGAMGIINKPMFRKSIRSQRCLVPADAFIEGSKKERLSKPYLIYSKYGERPFAFAGIWDTWVDISSGEIVNSFAIITTVSNSITRSIEHHRSPVILHPNDEQIWLNSNAELSEITGLLKPFPGEELNAYPIDPEIKSPKSNGFHLLEPAGPPVNKEYDYVIYDEIKLEGMGSTTSRKRRNGGEQGTLF